MKILILKILIGFAYILFYILMIFIYKNIVFPLWNQLGFYWEFNSSNFIISIILIFTLSIVLPAMYKKPSDLLLHIHFIFPILPMFVLYTVENLSSLFMFYTLLSFLLIIFIINKLKLFNKSISILNIDVSFIEKILMFSFIMFMILLFLKNKDFFNLDINKIYFYRKLVAESNKGIIAYVFYSILPVIGYILLSFSLIKRKKLFFVILTIGFIMLFALTSHRQFIFTPLLFIIAYWFIKNKKAILLAIITIYAGLFMSIILDIIWFEVLAKGLFIHRLLLVPAQLNFYFYDFFNQHKFVFWTDSPWLPLGKIIEYPYNLPVPKVIGFAYFGYDINANTGWIGAGYAHAGFIGMLIYSLFVALILKYLDIVARRLGNEFVTLSFFPFILSLFLSTDLKTVFLSSGLIFYLIILSFIRRLDRGAGYGKSMSYNNCSSTV